MKRTLQQIFNLVFMTVALTGFVCADLPADLAKVVTHTESKQLLNALYDQQRLGTVNVRNLIEHGLTGYINSSDAQEKEQALYTMRTGLISALASAPAHALPAWISFEAIRNIQVDSALFGKSQEELSGWGTSGFGTKGIMALIAFVVAYLCKDTIKDFFGSSINAGINAAVGTTGLKQEANDLADAKIDLLNQKMTQQQVDFKAAAPAVAAAAVKSSLDEVFNDPRIQVKLKKIDTIEASMKKIGRFMDTVSRSTYFKEIFKSDESEDSEDEDEISVDIGNEQGQGSLLPVSLTSATASGSTVTSDIEELPEDEFQDCEVPSLLDLKRLNGPEVNFSLISGESTKSALAAQILTKNPANSSV